MTFFVTYKLYIFTLHSPYKAQGFAGVCIERVIIVLACVVYSTFSQTLLIPDAEDAATAGTVVWNYLGLLLLNMLILAGTIKAVDRVSRKMEGCRWGSILLYFSVFVLLN